MENTNNTKLYRRALLLSYFTVGYNIVEGVVSILASAFSGSISLLGFGLDSVIESISGGIMIWRFGRHGNISEEEEEKIEKIATRLVAYTFFVLAAYVLYESIKKLFTGEISSPSLPGIIITVLSIIIMPVLFYSKYRTGKAIGSKSLIADSKETLACCFLSLTVLTGLGLNYFFGLWQADPIAGLVVVGFLAWEGIETLKGD
jgi:divalent metal cation (Fe/Co/Zn/Cd) transporter